MNEELQKLIISLLKDGKDFVLIQAAGAIQEFIKLTLKDTEVWFWFFGVFLYGS